jgi:hypothetical protein
VTRLRKALRWLAPFHALWLAERDAHAATRKVLAAAEACLDLEREVHAVTQIDLDAHRRHFAEAVRQRDRARAIAAELGGAPRWNEVDAEWLDKLGVEPA